MFEARSPVFTHLSSSLVGLTTVRAHQSQVIFQRVFDEAQDVHSSAWYMFLATTRWFGIWLDWICVTYVACVTFTCVNLRDCNDLIYSHKVLKRKFVKFKFFFFMPALSPSEAGLAISSAMALTGMFQWGVRQSAEVENQMTSVERVIEYSRLTPEAPLDSRPGSNLPDCDLILRILFLFFPFFNLLYFRKETTSNMAAGRQHQVR